MDPIGNILFQRKINTGTKKEFFLKSKPARLAKKERTLVIKRTDLNKTLNQLRKTGHTLLGTDAQTQSSQTVQVWFK